MRSATVSMAAPGLAPPAPGPGVMFPPMPTPGDIWDKMRDGMKDLLPKPDDGKTSK